MTRLGATGLASSTRLTATSKRSALAWTLRDASSPYLGSMGAVRLNKPAVGMAATSNGTGYWMGAGDGGIFAFGTSAFHGSTGSLTLNRPIVEMTSSATTGGYWFVASDGGIFS